ncbi:hypothetical protein SORBI_3006G163650 [Sorghum bicolor]|uniref:Uncharacterized protein n=1 Tax=Sorghum bicolor TaxID=4558 RepID=A0A1Z5REM7_SORBI|nr:hypothetical protein SORBI_3006G163650 [Sorghum bicolor]
MTALPPRTIAWAYRYGPAGPQPTTLYCRVHLIATVRFSWDPMPLPSTSNLATPAALETGDDDAAADDAPHPGTDFYSSRSSARDGVRWPGRRACMRCAPTDGGREAGDVSAAQLSARAPSPPRHGGRAPPLLSLSPLSPSAASQPVSPGVLSRLPPSLPPSPQHTRPPARPGLFACFFLFLPLDPFQLSTLPSFSPPLRLIHPSLSLSPLPTPSLLPSGRAPPAPASRPFPTCTSPSFPISSSPSNSTPLPLSRRPHQYSRSVCGREEEESEGARLAWRARARAAGMPTIQY